MQVPAGPECVLKVRGLQENEEYVFAVAAYDEEGWPLGRQMGQFLGQSSFKMGQLLGRPAGGSIGETGRPIVACHSLPVLIGWGYCCQVSPESRPQYPSPPHSSSPLSHSPSVHIWLE